MQTSTAKTTTTTTIITTATNTPKTNKRDQNILIQTSDMEGTRTSSSTKSRISRSPSNESPQSNVGETKTKGTTFATVGSARERNGSNIKSRSTARGKHKRARSRGAVAIRPTVPLLGAVSPERPLVAPPSATAIGTSSPASDMHSSGNSHHDSSDSVTIPGDESHRPAKKTRRKKPFSTVRTRSMESNVEVTIRPMRMKDIAPVYQLGNAVFTATDLPTLYRTWDDFAVVELFGSDPEFCFVAEDDDTKHVIGFLLGESITKSVVGTRGYVEWVAVHPDFRRHGIATKLMHAYQERATQKGITRVYADTQADNDPALRLFETVGLTISADHVYLTRQLPEETELNHVSEDGLFHYSYTAKRERITIRNMEIEDLHSVYQVGETIFTQDSPNLYNFWDEDLVIQSYLSDPDLCAVATIKNSFDDSESVIGFAFGTTIEKPRSSWKYGYLVWLGCSKDYQGLGLASQLYGVMLELFFLEKVRMVMIDTQKNNEAALSFFGKKGFHNAEEHVYLSNALQQQNKDA